MKKWFLSIFYFGLIFFSFLSWTGLEGGKAGETGADGGSSIESKKAILTKAIVGFRLYRTKSMQTDGTYVREKELFDRISKALHVIMTSAMSKDAQDQLPGAITLFLTELSNFADDKRIDESVRKNLASIWVTPLDEGKVHPSMKPVAGKVNDLIKKFEDSTKKSSSKDTHVKNQKKAAALNALVEATKACAEQITTKTETPESPTSTLLTQEEITQALEPINNNISTDGGSETAFKKALIDAAKKLKEKVQEKKSMTESKPAEPVELTAKGKAQSERSLREEQADFAEKLLQDVIDKASLIPVAVAQRATVLTYPLPSLTAKINLSGGSPQQASDFPLRDFLIRCYENHPDRNALPSNTETKTKMEQLLGLVDEYKPILISSAQEDKKFQELVHATAVAHYSDTLPDFITAVAACFIPQVIGTAQPATPGTSGGAGSGNKAQIIATLNELVPGVAITQEPVMPAGIAEGDSSDGSGAGKAGITGGDTGTSNDGSGGTATVGSDISSTGESTSNAGGSSAGERNVVVGSLPSSNNVQAHVEKSIEKLKKLIAGDSSDQQQIMTLCMTIDFALPTLFFSLDDIIAIFRKLVNKIISGISFGLSSGIISLEEFIKKVAETIKSLQENAFDAITALSENAKNLGAILLPWIKKFVCLLVPIIIIAVYWYLTSNAASQLIIKGFSALMPSLLQSASDAANVEYKIFVDLVETSGIKVVGGTDFFSRYAKAKAFSFDNVLGLERADFMKLFEEYATLYKVVGGIVGIGIGYLLDKMLDPIFDLLLGKVSTEPTSFISWNTFSRAARYTTRSAVLYSFSSFANDIFDANIGLDALYLKNYENSVFMATAGSGQEGVALAISRNVLSLPGSVQSVIKGLSPEFNPLGGFSFNLFNVF